MKKKELEKRIKELEERVDTLERECLRLTFRDTTISSPTKTNEIYVAPNDPQVKPMWSTVCNDSFLKANGP